MLNPNMESIVMERIEQIQLCSLCHQGNVQRVSFEACLPEALRTDFIDSVTDDIERVAYCEKCQTLIHDLVRAKEALFDCVSELLTVARRPVTEDEKKRIATKLCQHSQCFESTNVSSSEAQRVPSYFSSESTADSEESTLILVLADQRHEDNRTVQCAVSNEKVSDGEVLIDVSGVNIAVLQDPISELSISRPISGQSITEVHRKSEKSAMMCPDVVDCGHYQSCTSGLKPGENLGYISQDGVIANDDTDASMTSFSSDTVGPSIPETAIATNARKKRARKQHICSICNRSCKTARELDQHIGVHLQERKYICEICGLAYRHKKALEVHVGLHRGEAKFECEHCHKVFTQKSGLQRHLPIHTGEMAYQCDICGKRFLYNTSFNVHKFTHTKHKGFQCFQCGLSFFSKSHLKRHMKTHSGVKPHVCEKCGKCFSERYNLEAHMRIHTGQKTHQCPHCDAGFNRKAKLEKHLIQKHL